MQHYDRDGSNRRCFMSCVLLIFSFFLSCRNMHEWSIVLEFRFWILIRFARGIDFIIKLLNCKKIFHVYSVSCNHMQIYIFAKISKKIERDKKLFYTLDYIFLRTQDSFPLKKKKKSNKSIDAIIKVVIPLFELYNSNLDSIKYTRLHCCNIISNKSYDCSLNKLLNKIKISKFCRNMSKSLPFLSLIS